MLKSSGLSACSDLLTTKSISAFAISNASLILKKFRSNEPCAQSLELTMHVLIVRLSSMGDVVHTLPALSDAASANPSIRFDWAVDESFAQIPAWHRNVETVFRVALRRWQRSLSSSAGRAEVKAFLKTLRAKQYDLVVDLQGE